MMQQAWSEARQKTQTRAAETANASVYTAFQARYFDHLADFARDCVVWPAGQRLTSYQDEILIEIPKRKRSSVVGPHGLGKTAMMAIITLWFALTRDGKDWKVVTTASAWRQLIKYLWPEIHKWARMLNWRKIGKNGFSRDEILTLTLKLKTGEAFAVASDNPALIEGAHADHMLYIFDESKSVIPGTFDAAEGALSQANALAVAMSTPGEPNGRFYDIHSKKAGYTDWWTRHVTKQELIAAGRMDATWADNRKLQWGEKSAVYLNRVEGLFAASDEDSVIPLRFVEAANERWQALKDTGRWGLLTAIGADIARTGNDKTVFALRHGDAIKELRKFEGADTMQTAGRLAALMAAHEVPALVDTVGLGAGVYDNLREQRLGAIAFTASARTNYRDRSGEYHFADVRSAAWWNLREMLEDGQVALPPDDDLTGDLTAPKWRVTSGARIRVESKDDIGKRLKRSTDSGDAVVQAYWDGMQITEEGDNPLAGYRG